MAKYVYNVRVEANEYEPLEELLDAAGYDSELLDTYEGDEDDGIDRGISAIKLYNQHDVKRLIESFVKTNYGDSEAENPSWNIDALAEYIANQGNVERRYEIIKHETKDYWYIWDNEADAQVCEPDGDPWHFDSLEEAEEWVEDMMS